MWCGELLVELLMEKISFECVEEALLHAISKGATKPSLSLLPSAGRTASILATSAVRLGR